MEADFNQEKLFAVIAVPIPVANLFTYLVPPELQSQIKIGVRASVPFRNREITGYVVGFTEERPRGKLKPIISILDSNPVLSESILNLTKWVSEYYECSWGEAIENALPRWVKYGKKEKKYIEKANEKRVEDIKKITPFVLTEDQKKACALINSQLKLKSPKPVLLFGVTGSGKSEIYIRTIYKILEKNKSAICLVPEIALTEQLKLFFYFHFGSKLEILHSKMSDGERFLTWKRIEMGHCRVVLGPRSAVFAPTPNLGLIIMDEEHEGSYKQETTPRYHAREVAKRRALSEGALFVMGTATPSLETMHETENGSVIRIDLLKRVEQKTLPKVHIIDNKLYVHDTHKHSLLTPPLFKEIERNLKCGEGTMLLLNRRGFSTYIQCPICGEVETCPQCKVSLTFHQEQNSLLCHYCNFKKNVSTNCKTCGKTIFRFSGFGTEKVESAVARCFPGAKIARMDRDTVRRKNSHEKILEDFRAKKIDVLIGTQMIAKGFDFKHVTLVGVISADVGLRLPDFRAGERTFQLLTQFAGRAGRGEKPGRVYIQTFSPEHSSILFAKEHDFVKFYKHEMSLRSDFCYPPFCRLVNIIVRSKNEKKAYLFAREVKNSLEKLTSVDVKGNTIGPTPLPFYKLRGHFRWHVMLKIPKYGETPLKIYSHIAGLKKPSAVAFAVDVDPLNIL